MARTVSYDQLSVSVFDAVRAALEGSITPDCPASILRTAPHARLYLDHDSAALLGTRGQPGRG